MVVGTAPEPGSFLLLAQDRAQAPSDKTVKEFELARNSMFEVAEPAPKHGIEVGDDPPKTHTSASSTPELGATQRLLLLLFRRGSRSRLHSAPFCNRSVPSGDRADANRCWPAVGR